MFAVVVEISVAVEISVVVEFSAAAVFSFLPIFSDPAEMRSSVRAASWEHHSISIS